MEPIDFLAQLVLLVVGITMGSLIYTKLIIKYIVKDEIRDILSKVAEALNNDAKTKEKLKDVIGAVAEECKKKGREVVIDIISDVMKELWSKKDLKDLPNLEDFMREERGQ